MFAKLGRIMVRWRWQVIALWGILLLAALPILPKVEEPLKVGGFSSPNTEASRARAAMEQELGATASQIVVIFQSDTLDANSPEFQDQVQSALAGIDKFPNVVDVILPSQDPHLIAGDGTTAYALIGLDLPPEEAQRDVPAFKAALHQPADLTMTVAGGPALYADIETVSQRDLRRAELIAFPFALIALLIVFGSLVAAVVPLAVGGLGVAAVLLSLYWIGHSVDLSIFVLNLATMLGLGLAVDYSLFITSRFREELARSNGDVNVSVERTIATAGRAIFFSGITVLIGLSGLSFFSFMFLRSVGIAGVIVVFFAVLAALTLLPAMLSIIGTRIDRGRIVRIPHGDEGDHGFWAVLSHKVMAHPVLVLIPTLAFLVFLGSPFLNVNVSSPDATILPNDLESRQGFNILTEKYGEGEISPFVVVLQAPGTMQESDQLNALYDLSTWLSEQPEISRVQSAMAYDEPVPYSRAEALLSARSSLAKLGVDTRLDQFINDDAAIILAYPRTYPNSPENKALLDRIRDQQPGAGITMLVDGGTAEIVDVVDLMYHDFPIAIGMIVIATYIVLLILFRSVLLPLKAIAMNTLSILASYGALVYFFQEGHFNNLLRFDKLGFVEASLPVIMFCVLFGLSMDYEVFLLSRVKEEWERTGDNAHSVAVGLQRSGRIITSAAAIVVVVTASFVSADVILIKALGLGIALAVLIDATIVRALLVPATMRLLGKWNWWMPASLERFLPAKSLTEEST